MPSLRELQADIARAVLLGEPEAAAVHVMADGIAAEQRLALYQGNVRAALTTALRLTFPAVERLVGVEFFTMAAARCLRANSPCSAWLDEYGAAFPGFLGAMPECATLPYLADVARFEHALSVAAHAPDEPALDLAALAAVPPSRHAALRFRAHPSVTLLRCDAPVDAIADAALADDADALAAIDPCAGPVHLVVHRGAEGVVTERIDAMDYCFLDRLFGGATLAALLEAAGADAAGLLAHQFITGRIAGFSEADP
ncbi:MAG: DNA-binding domain-containing protein [Acetobacteraceae bacterium]